MRGDGKPPASGAPRRRGAVAILRLGPASGSSWRLALAPACGRGLPLPALRRDAFRELLAAGLAIPLLVGLRRDLSLDQKLRELAPLRRALERHLVDHLLDPPIRHQPHQRDRDVDRARRSTVDEGERDGGGIQDDRQPPLRSGRPPPSARECGALRRDDRAHQDRVGDAATSAAPRHRAPPAPARRWFSPIQAVVNGTSDSQNSRCRLAHRIPPVTRSHDVEHVMMIVPVDAEEHEAQRVGAELRRQAPAAPPNRAPRAS